MTWLYNANVSGTAWSSILGGFKVKAIPGHLEEDLVFGFDRMPVEFTTSEHCIVGPSEEINFMAEVLGDALMAYAYEHYDILHLSFPCYDLSVRDLPSFYLLIGGYWLEVRP